MTRIIMIKYDCKIVVLSALIIAISVICVPFSFAQTPKVDSLRTALATAKHDTTRINTLNALGWELIYTNPDTAIILSTQALALAEGLPSPVSRRGAGGEVKDRAIANSLGNLGVYHYLKSDYPKALDYYLKALKIDEELGNKNGIVSDLINIGVVYWAQGDYPKALNYYFSALKMDEKLGDKNGIASDLSNIGVVYENQGDYPKALDYYFRALKMYKELRNQNGTAVNLSNIGIVYWVQGDYPKALNYYFSALKMYEELGDKNGIAINLSNIGVVYRNQGDYPKALDHYFRALKMYEELGIKAGIATNLGNIGLLYTKTGKFKEAEEYLKQAIAIDSAIGAKNFLMQFEEAISHLYDTLAQMAAKGKTLTGFGTLSELWKKSFEHYKKYITARDTINSEENQKKQVRTEMNYEFEKKEAAAKAEQDKKDAIAAEEKQRQKVITWSVSIGLFLVLLLALFIFRGYRQKQKANIIITQQKKVVEEKNKNITDSIRYAQNIQSAILPSEAEIKKALPEHFIYYQPKDIVSGDFYWFTEKVGNLQSTVGNKEENLPTAPALRDRLSTFFLAVCDCTGHGVPGAFVSMIGNDLLNKIIIEKQIENPGEILTQLNKGVKSVFTREGERQQAQDGMDMALCCLTPNPSPNGAGNCTLHFAGANNPLILIQNGELSVIKGDKTAIGGDTGINYTFKDNNIKLKKGDAVYMFSDGYKDQFGGDTRAGREFGEGKKFMMKRFKELLLSIHTKDMSEQKKIIQKTMADWKGNLEQADDICVVGVRV